MLSLRPDERILVMAPIVRGRKGEFKKELEKLARQGFVRARIDGTMRSLEEEIALDKRRNHTIEVIVDRLLVKPGIEKRLEASIETATKLANGLVLISVVGWRERLYSQKLACVECGTSVPELEPRSFSFNSPYGACEECSGIGSTWAFDPDKVIVDPVEAAARRRARPGRGIAAAVRSLVQEAAKSLRIKLKTPWEKLPAKPRVALRKALHRNSRHSRHARENLRRRPGRLQRMAHGIHVACPLPRLRRQASAPASLAVRVRTSSIAEFTAMPISRALLTARSWELTDRENCRSRAAWWMRSAAVLSFSNPSGCTI